METPSMAIYTEDRVANELRELEREKQSLTVEDVNAIDSMHYCGHEPMELAISNLQLTSASNVLDVGSGYGGAVRYLASRVGCRCTAVELQPHISELSAAITSRLQLQEMVTSVTGDISSCDLPAESFDGFISILVVLHVPEDLRAQLWQSCYSLLKPGASFYLECYFERGQLTEEEKALLKEVVSCPFVPSHAGYVQQLEQSGFTDVQLQDVTDTWLAFTTERYQAFEANEERHLRVHGPSTTAQLKHFYSTTNKLFRTGNLGGCRITGRKPTSS